MPFRDWYYPELGVEPTASQKQIVAKWRYLARIYHPDNRDTGDKEKFQRLNEAYQILGDAEKRKEYDAWLARLARPLEVEPERIDLGPLQWDEIRGVSFSLLWTSDSEFQDLIDAHRIGIDVSWQGSSQPAWATEFRADLGEQRLAFFFEVHGSAADTGDYEEIIETTIFNGTDLFSSHQVKIAFTILPLKTNLRLEGSDAIRIGPMIVGNAQEVRARILNEGAVLPERPIVSWLGGTPPWAGEIKVRADTGVIFPLGFSFHIHTNGCDPGNSPFTAMIEVSIKGKTVYQFPVILRVVPVPRPDVQPEKNSYSFGILNWYEKRRIDVRLDNYGDPPQNAIQARVVSPPSWGSSQWLKVIEISPAGLESFPKKLIVEADARKIRNETKEANDLLTTVELTDGVNVVEIPFTCRVDPVPEIQSFPAALELLARDNTARGKIVLTASGPIPLVKIRWGRFDWHTMRPQITKTDWPCEVEVGVDLTGFHGDEYRNQLHVGIHANPETYPIYTLSIPVVVSRH